MTEYLTVCEDCKGKHPRRKCRFCNGTGFTVIRFTDIEMLLALIRSLRLKETTGPVGENEYNITEEGENTHITIGCGSGHYNTTFNALGKITEHRVIP